MTQPPTPGAPIDCSARDNQQTHLSEASQPHGVSLVIDKATPTICRVTENRGQALSLPTAALQTRIPRKALNS